MVIGKMKPVATVVAQFAAGVEVECICHNGKMFLPVMGSEFISDAGGSDSSSDSDASEKPAKPETKPEKPSKKGGEKSGKAEDKKYTLEDLMETDSKELVNILKKEFGIDPSDYDGKNTNKKLRDLILKAQDGELSEKEADEDTDDEGGNDELVDKIADLLEAFDAGEKTKKKVVAAIVDMGDDVDEDAVLDLINGFEEDGDADIEEVAAKIADVVDGEVEEEEEEEKKPSKKGPKKSSKKDEDLVDVEDLEVGDRVSVWWNDDNKEWFDGEVKSIKKGKVVIAYDDDTEEPIDPEVHTKIKRLAE